MAEQEWFYAWLAAWGVCGGLIAAIFRTWNPFHLVGGGFIASLVVGIAVAEWRDWRGISEAAVAAPDTSRASFSIEPGELDYARVEAAAVAVGAACPGLARYAEDFSVAQAEPTSMLDFEGGITIRFTVANPPKVLPLAIRKKAAGHRCSISVTPDNACAYIAKSACHSICEGKPEQNDPNSMGRMLALESNGCSGVE